MIRSALTSISRIKMIKPLLMCLDFDNTIVDKNTDIVARNLLPEEELKDAKILYDADECWTSYMRKLFEMLHSSGITEEVLMKNINSTPATTGFPDLLKNLHNSNCEIIIISDANSMFIESWLKYHKLDHTITKIFTNHAWFDEKRMLNIKEYQYQDWCKLSEKNLCKGYVLETYIKQRSKEGVEFERVAYAGDGRNDYCPILKLSEYDLAFPRENYYIMKCLKKSEQDNVVKAKIIPWTSGTDIWNYLHPKE